MCVSSDKTRILLVEDSEDDAFFFDLALKRSAWPCDRTHMVDGGQAVHYLEDSRKSGSLPDLVFLDLKLPVLTGFEVLEWIAAQNFRPQLRVVILSGSDHQADIVRARELGASDYLVKPVSVDELKKRLSALPSGPQFDNSRIIQLKTATQ
jgi:DNA-binding response OmpR family regulator